MNKKKFIVAGALTGALALGGCGGDSKTGSADSVAAKTATVSLSVTFPSDETVQKAVIPSYTEGVGFRYCRLTQESDWCDLFGESAAQVLVTRAQPSATVSLLPGKYMFGAAVSTSTDMSDMSSMFDFAQTSGEIVEGANTVIMTFLQGDWTFKTGGGVADPVTLGNSTVISGFKLKASPYQMYTASAAARKAAFDMNQGVGWMEYAVTLNTSVGNKAAGMLGVASQFHSGNSNNATLVGMEYNLTQDCSDSHEQSNCEESPGDWLVMLMGNTAVEDSYYEDSGAESLLPAETLTNGSGTPIDINTDSRPTDGVTIVADLVEAQIGSRTVTLIDTTATATKAVAADMPRSRVEALRHALGQLATKSVTTTNLGTVISTWYDPVIMASGDGSNRGTWNFDDWVWNETTQSYDQVVDGCLETDSGSGKVYAEKCGYLGSTWDEATSSFVTDPGEFGWGLAPTDLQNLGEYDSQCDGGGSAVGVYSPWCFWDTNNDGVVNTGSFQFTHYMKVEETVNNVRIHNVTAKGVELPVTEVVIQ